MKKVLSFCLIVLALGLLAVGCSKKEAKVEQRAIFNLAADPASVDPQKNNAVDGSNVIYANFEGLYYEDGTPATAESVDVSNDGKVYTFKIRPTAKWSDGVPVKAQDFEYAWKRGLDPATACEYAYQFFYIKNGEAFNTGKAKIEDVGVKALDDSTLEVTLESPTAYFLSLTAQAVMFPVRKDIVEKDPAGWATKAETYVGNGPFKMTEMNPKDSLKFVKNPNYWDVANVKLEELVMTEIVDSNTFLNSFKKGEIDLFDTPPLSEVPTLLADGTAKTHPYLGAYYYVINVKGTNQSPEVAKFIGNAKVRKALSLAIDRETITNEVTKGGQLPAKAFVPRGVKATDGKEFATVDFISPKANVEEAKKLLAEAGYADPASMPTITFTFNTEGSHGTIAQAIQDMWKNSLGLNVELKQEEWAVFQTTRNTQNYEIARHGWIADYNDPMTFLDLWVSTGGQNNAKYDNAEYDKLIKEAKAEGNPEKRTAILHKAEAILMNDMPILPIYDYSINVVANPKFQGWTISPLGGYNFKNAYMEVEKK